MEKKKNRLSATEIVSEAASDILLENPFSKNYKKISTHINYDAKPLKIKQDNIRVALVSLKVPDKVIEKTESKIYDSRFKNCPQHIDDGSCQRLIHHYKFEDIYFNNYKLALELALNKYESDIVCFQELAFPTKKKKPSSIAVKLIEELARKHNSLIITGTFHDSRTLYNTGIVCYPCDDSIICHQYCHKQVSAKDLGELINIPSTRKSISISAFGLRIAIVICLDLLDYSTIAPLCDRNNEIDIILIPSFSENTVPLQKIAENISEVIAGGVAIVNRHTVGGQSHPGMIYMFGKKLEHSSKNANYPNYIIRTLPGNIGKIILHDIHYDTFSRKQHHTKHTINEDLKWLFGLPTNRKR